MEGATAEEQQIEGERREVARHDVMFSRLHLPTLAAPHNLLGVVLVRRLTSIGKVAGQQPMPSLAHQQLGMHARLITLSVPDCSLG